MGIASSSNTIKSMLDASIQVTNNFAQTCSLDKTDAVASITIGKDCKITNSDIIVNANQVVTQSCITNANLQLAIASSISQTMRQAAEAVVQQFGFPSVARANNFIDTSVRMGDQISTTFNSVCSTIGSNSSANFSCQGGTIDTSVISVQTFQNITQDCITNAIVNTEIYNKLIQDLSETASAKQQATFLYILIAFVLILAIAAWFVISIADNPVTQWAVVGLILFSVIGSVIYTISARSSGSYPYRKV